MALSLFAISVLTIGIKSQCADPTKFDCESGTPLCIEMSQVCDGTYDCDPDGFVWDEAPWAPSNCPNITTTMASINGVDKGIINCNDAKIGDTSGETFHFYTFTLTDPLTRVELKTCGSAFDNVLQILYEEPPTGNLTELYHCDDCGEACAQYYNNDIILEIFNGVYHIVVAGNPDRQPYPEGAYNLQLNCFAGKHYLVADVDANDLNLNKQIDFIMNVNTEFYDVSEIQNYSVHCAFDFQNGACDNPTVTFVHEEVNLLGSDRDLKVYSDYYLADVASNTLLATCAGGNACGSYDTCLDMYPLGPLVQDEILYFTIWKSAKVKAQEACNHNFTVIGNLTISCIVPTPAPTYEPTLEPTVSTDHPSKDPTIEPTFEPTLNPTTEPTFNPTAVPTNYPTNDPTDEPTYHPTYHPSNNPTFYPTNEPTYHPTYHPSFDPTNEPTYHPTFHPTFDPTNEPTSDPTDNPTNNPSFDPTNDPTFDPTNDPTNDPTFEPTFDPTSDPTSDPTTEPTAIPTTIPTDVCDYDIENYFEQFIFKILTVLDNDEEFESDMKHLLRNAFRNTLISQNGFWDELWCFVIPRLEFESIIISNSSPNRRLLQAEENNIQIVVDFAFNDGLWQFIANNVNENAFLSQFLDEIVNEGLLNGLIQNETDIFDLVVISNAITTTEYVESKQKGKKDILNTSKPWIWIIIFGIIILCVTIFLLTFYMKLRNKEKRPLYGQTTELGAFQNKGEGEGGYDNEPLAVVHKTCDTLDLADEIAKELEQNKVTDYDLL